jgi:hypothetical protein
MLALYRFEERQGTVVHDLSGHAPNLYIPSHFRILHQPFLAAPWVEYDPGWDYWEDFLINILGFIPLGFFVSAYVSRVRGYHRVALIATICGFIVSLIIEVSQGFMPMRHSGTTDLFTNTLGTYLGSLLYFWKPVARFFEDAVVRACPHQFSLEPTDRYSVPTSEWRAELIEPLGKK